MKNLQIISGGQTGADVAGLWVAKTLGIQTGGYSPAGFKTLIGDKPQLASLFGLQEHEGGYRERTIANVEQADLTLIFARSIDSPGTKLTINTCNRLGCPYYVFRDTRILGKESVNQAWDAMLRCQDPPHRCVQLAISFIREELKTGKLLDVDGPLTINIAGNATKRTIPDIFEFTFVGLWRILNTAFGGLPAECDLAALEPFAKQFKDRYEP